MSILLFFVTTISALPSLSLYRGAPIPAPDNPTVISRYWFAEDVTLWRSQPRLSDGQSEFLTLSPETRVLIRFGDLERALGPNRRILRARLVLSLARVERGGTLTVRRFLTDWNEGPGRGRREDIDLQWSSTWSYQFFNEKGPTRRWRDGGTDFLSREKSFETSVDAGAGEVVIQGLEKDVEFFYHHWYENFGWALEFTGSAWVFSSQGERFRPRLEVEFEPVEEKQSSDLSVIYISRQPEYERYDNRGDAYVRTQVGGHESGIMMRPGKVDTPKWPKDGEPVTYTAVVKNVGVAPAEGFRYEWWERYERKASGEVSKRLAPGETTEITFRTAFRNEHHDHRTQPVAFRIYPHGLDVNSRNNFLEIQACALNIGIWVDEDFYAKFSQGINGVGSRSFEDWIQWQFRIWNDVFFRHSRFSIAPDGCRERVRIQKITIVPVGTLKGGAHIPDDTPTLTFDGEWGFDSTFGEVDKYISEVRQRVDRALLHELSHQIGLLDMYWMNVDPSLPDGARGKVKLKHDGRVITQGHFDLYAGLMGGGDTRNEWLVPYSLPLPQEPGVDPVFQNALMEATDLYSLTDIAGLHANLGFRRGFYGEYLYSLPAMILIRCTDREGVPIEVGTLSFYQMKRGEIPDGEPDFTVSLINGSALLPNRDTGLPAPFTTVTGHTLKPNPFGRIDVVGTNGVFLVKLETEGQTEWGFLKLWELVDAYFRGNKSALVYEMRFNVTRGRLNTQDLALRKIVVDSADTPLAQTQLLVDGDLNTLYRAPEQEGGWFEVDIGRDLPIGEIQLVVKGDVHSFWKSFDILVYSTGQRAMEARLFAREWDWRHSVDFHADVDPGDFSIRRVAYRARPQTVRYIRFVNRGGGEGRLSALEVRAVQRTP